MKKLHKKQQELLHLLKESIDDPLTIRELQDRLGISSPSLVYHHIKQLEAKGYLRRNPNDTSDYQILADSPDKKIAYLNLYGMAQCGPNGSILEGQPIDRIPISSKILGFSARNAFLVKARGRSMEPKIKSGDLVVVEQSDTPRDGDIVVCTNNDVVMIKKIQRFSNTFVLTSLNDEFKPIMVEKNDFRVEGIVRGVLSYT